MVPDTRRIQDFIRLLAELDRSHERLIGIVQEKIDAMRRADTEAIRQATSAERECAGHIQEREGLRRQIADMIGDQLGLEAGAGRAMALSQFSERIAQPDRQMLLKIGGKLKETIARLARVNMAAGRIAQDLLNHLKWVFASVKPNDGGPDRYNREGLLAANDGTQILEAIG